MKVTERRGISVEPLVEPLTRREREVLGLLAEGLSAPEIADRLFLAVSSIKWHIQQLYGKLGVNSKRQALSRAGELGLLGTSHARHGATAFETAEPAPRHNLPAQVTRFFGREPEIAQLQARLAEHRLVTLTGSGGVGKTRLLLRAAEEALDDFADGVWFVGLSPLSDPSLVNHQVAASLRLRDERGQPLLVTLTHYLRDRQTLLVLDNCEHLLGACAQLADGLLPSCPRVKILASSREPLGSVGEALFVVPSLPFPEPKQTHSLERLGDYASLRLFVDRARLVFPAYQLTAHNLAAVTRICQRLDGIPLAIEMAAARVTTLTAEQLADRLDDAFRVLVGGSRTALPRHQTIRGTIDWSYQLLTGLERLLLQRLSVFAGGCTPAAAESVCSGEGLETDQVLDVLASLAAKSMVLIDRRQGEPARYRLLETVRQYGRERLNETGEASRLHARHRDFYRSFAETSIAQLDTLDAPLWNRRLLAELDNFRQALAWSFNDEGDVEAGPRLVMVFTKRPIQCHSHREQLVWHMRALALCNNRMGISPQLHVQLLERASGLVALNDPETAFGLSKRAIEICRSLGPEGREMLMWTLYNMAWDFAPHIHQSEQILAPLAEAEDILKTFGPGHYSSETWLKLQASFATLRAEIAICHGRYADAKVHATEGIRLLNEGGGLWSKAEPHTRLGIACYYLGDYQKAWDHLIIALDMTRTLHGWEISYNLRWLAATDIATGNLERALGYCLESIRLADELPDRNITASSLGLLAAISAQQGHTDRAARLAGASAAMWAKQKRKPWEDSSLETLLPGWRDGPAQAEIEQAYAAGQAMSSGEAVAYALGNQTA